MVVDRLPPGRTCLDTEGDHSALAQLVHGQRTCRRPPASPCIMILWNRVSVSDSSLRQVSSPSQSSFRDRCYGGDRLRAWAGPRFTLAAYTGFRKGEIGSLTLRSLHLEGNPPTATVLASFSKRRRQDTQVLHPDLAQQLKNWLATKRTGWGPTICFLQSPCVPAASNARPTR